MVTKLARLLSTPPLLSLFLLLMLGTTPALAIYTVAPNTIDFGTVSVGSSSGATTVTFTNNNTSGSISFSSITATAGYNITNNCPMVMEELVLGPGLSCTVDVVFTPQAAGPSTGQLTFSGNDEGLSYTATVALSGDGQAVVDTTSGEFSLSPTTLDFGAIEIDASSEPLTVTLTNTGDAGASISSIITTSGFSQTNNCTTSLAINRSCTIMLSASPTEMGELTGSLTVSGMSNQGEISQSIPLSANGVSSDTPDGEPNDLNVSVEELSFSGVVVNEPSEPQMVTLINQGDAALIINSITTEGDFTQTNDCGTELAAGASCQIQVIFSTNTAGATTGALNIATSGGLKTILLSGNADANGDNGDDSSVGEALKPFAGGNPNLLSLVEIIAEACPSGRLDDRLQQDCNAVVGAAIEGDANTSSALQQVNPETAMKANTTSRQGGEAQIRNLGTRIAALRAGARGLSFNGLDLLIDDQTLPIEMIANSYRHTTRRGGGASEDDPLLASRLGVFITGDISTGKRDETDLESGLDFDTAGITIGADYRITHQFILGGALGFVNTEAELEDNAGDLDTQGYSLSLFGTYYSPQNYFIDFSATFGANDFDQKRNIVYVLDGLADVNQQLKADYDGDTTSLFIGSGYDFNRGPWSFGPRADLEYIKSDVDGFTEEASDPLADGGGWATRLDGTGQRWLTLKLGGKVSYTHSTDWGVMIPYARLDWMHEFENDSQVINAYFVGDPDPFAIAIENEDPDRDYLRLRFGTSAQFQNGVVGFLDLGTILAHSQWSSSTISAGLRMEF
jgi:outer membrane autotransporter protein